MWTNSEEIQVVNEGAITGWVARWERRGTQLMDGSVVSVHWTWRFDIRLENGVLVQNHGEGNDGNGFSQGRRFRTRKQATCDLIESIECLNKTLDF